MDYNTPLITAQFLKRYKRFFADVIIDGKEAVAHVPNTGSLKGICDLADGRLCLVSPATNPERKLRFTLEQVQVGDTWVGVNTHKANELAWETFQLKVVPHWQRFTQGAREVKINAETRLDMKLSGPQNENLFVEVKSVTLARDGIALFPDAVTTRGQKHLNELAQLVAQGAQAELLFVVQRTDCRRFIPADDIDPTYGRLLREVQKKGVRLTAYAAALSNNHIQLNTQAEVHIDLG